MSLLDWTIAACIACGVLAWLEARYRRLETLACTVANTKIALDESQADCLDRICGRLEVIGHEIAEANAMMSDEWTTTDSDGEWKLN